MMELKSICKSFGENEVLRDISMIIPKGGRVLITAPSGRGKTTLLPKRTQFADTSAHAGKVKPRDFVICVPLNHRAARKTPTVSGIAACRGVVLNLTEKSFISLKLFS